MSHTPAFKPSVADDPDRTLTFNEGCDFIKMSKRWTWEQVKKGLIPHFRCGRAIRFRREALIDWCRLQEQKAGAK